MGYKEKPCLVRAPRETSLGDTGQKQAAALARCAVVPTALLSPAETVGPNHRPGPREMSSPGAAPHWEMVTTVKVRFIASLTLQHRETTVRAHELGPSRHGW